MYNLPEPRRAEPAHGLVGTPPKLLRRNLRILLKYPLGALLSSAPEISYKLLIQYLNFLRPRKIIAVGDFVTNNLVNRGIYPDIIVIDGKVERKKYKIEINTSIYTIIKIKNPPSTLNIEIFKLCDEISKDNRRYMVIVDGEEDLLTLPLIYYSPETSVVVYGLPKLGVVITPCDKSKKRFVKKVLRLMRSERHGD